MCKCIVAKILNVVLTITSVIIGVAVLSISAIQLGYWYDGYKECHGGTFSLGGSLCKNYDLYVAGAAFGILAGVIHIFVVPILPCCQLWKTWAVFHFIICVFTLIAFILPMSATGGYSLADVIKGAGDVSFKVPDKSNPPKSLEELDALKAGIRRTVGIFFLLFNIIDCVFSPIAGAIVWCVNRESATPAT